MLYLFIGLFIIVLVYLMITLKIKIKIKTFFKKGFEPTRTKFGVYCYTGKQGTGKTYSLIEYLQHNKDMKIFSNIRKIEGIDFTYFSGLDNLLKLRSQKNCIIVYDEIFTALTKSTRIDTDVLDFLSQMRKRNIIFLTTAQEWLEINITLRRYVRYQIDCMMIRIPVIKDGLLIKRVRDGDNMRWDNDENEYIAPIIETTISKVNKYVADSYDTYEQIKS